MPTNQLQTPRNSAPAPAPRIHKGFVRHALFLCGLLALLSSAAAYVWIQAPLRSSISLERQLAENVGRIMTLDEVLTMSARMAAAARDKVYEDRYNAHVDELDRLIRETVALTTNPEITNAVRSTDEANRRLVEMEAHSFELDHAQRHQEALRLLEGAEYRARKSEYAAGMSRAFSLLERETSEHRASVERRASVLQVLALLALGIVLGAWALEQRERRRRAAGYAAELAATVELRTRELASRNRSMRLVLDSVQQGLIGVDLAGRIAPERSAIVDRWFGAVDTGIGFADWVQVHDPRFAEWFAMGLEQLRDGVLPSDLCIAQLPKRLQLGERVLAADYECILANGSCDGLLVVLSDITAQIAHERTEAEQSDLVSVLECIARDRVGFLNFLHEADGMVDGLVEPHTGQHLNAAQLLHTLKGNSAQFGLSLVARLCHEIEERLCENGRLLDEDRSLLDSTWRGLKTRIRALISDRAVTHLEVDRHAFDDVMALVGQRARHDDILGAMLAWTLDPVQARLERLADYARALADRLGKPGLEVVCDAHGLRIDPVNWASFWPVCVHLIRNALDHGIELPEVRSACGKPESGRLELSASREQAEFVVRFSDDGAGIDWEALKLSASARGIAAGTERARVEALFHDGISSRNEVTEVSGRGVGLAAVRDEVLRRAGAIAVASSPGRGVTVEIRFPTDPLPSASLRAEPGPVVEFDAATSAATHR